MLGLLGLAGQRLRTADPSVARALFDSAERVLPPRDLQLRAAHRCGRAALFARTARPEAVSEAFTSAALARRVGDRRQESACLLIAANGQVRLGKLREATVLFDRIIAQLRKLHDRAGLATVLQWSGYTAFTQEQHDRAQRLLGQAIREAEASSNVSALAWSLLDLAQVSLALADPVSAAEQTDRAIGLLRQLGDQWGVTTALGLQAQLAFDIGDTARAGLLLVELAEGAVRDNDAVAEAEVQIALAALALHRRDRTATSEALDRARRAMLRAGRSALQASLPYQRGVVALRWGDFAGARRLFRTVLEATDTGQRITRYLAEARLAEASLRLGDTVEAERRLVHASDELDTWRASLSDSTLRILAFQVLDQFGGEDLGTASVVAAIAAKGNLASAFQLAERRRARELRDQLLRSGARPTAKAGTVEAGDLAALAAALPDEHTALLEYVTGSGGQPTTALIVTRAGGRAVGIAPLDTLVEPVGRLLAILSSGLPDSSAATRLGDALLAPVLAALPAGITHLVIVPDDALHRVPFAALRTRAGPLLDRYTIELTPSAAVAGTLWSRPLRNDPPRVLAFGDPAFPADDPRQPPATRAHFAAFAERGGLPRLPASEGEARSAASVWPAAEVRLRAGASEAFLKQATLEPFRILPFATHAQVDDRALGRSALALVGGGGQDGFVTPGDLAGLDLKADLVVLSGCGTALGVLVGG